MESFPVILLAVFMKPGSDGKKLDVLTKMVFRIQKMVIIVLVVRVLV